MWIFVLLAALLGLGLFCFKQARLASTPPRRYLLFVLSALFVLPIVLGMAALISYMITG